MQNSTREILKGVLDDAWGDDLSDDLKKVVEEIDADARDAARWRALMACRMHFMGSAGFRYENATGGRAERFDKDCRIVIPKPGEEGFGGGYLHFGMEFWSSHAEAMEKRNPIWAGLMEKFADYCIANPESVPSDVDVYDPLINRMSAEAEGWGLFESGDGMLTIQADDDGGAFTGDRANLDAFDHVKAMADRGSVYHQRALALHGTGAEETT